MTTIDIYSGFLGAGKTTLFKMLVGQEQPDTGTVKVGDTVQFAYVDQGRESLEPGKSVYDIISEGHDTIKLGSREVNARAYCTRFNFHGADQQKKVDVLSGGERNRLHLARMLKSGANVLLLDEPTNNLDPASREEILKAIAKYEGAIVLVTHDEGAVEALNPERVLLMPDGDEDLWNDSYLELVAEE